MGEPNRSKWRYEEGGAALEAANRFISLLKVLTMERLEVPGIPDVSGRLDEVRERVTEASWPHWQDAIRTGFEVGKLNEFKLVSQKVRFPADGMAYVFWPVTHVDQNEPIEIDGPQQMYLNVVTLLDERGAWRVHQIGMMVPPRDLGLRPYSW